MYSHRRNIIQRGPRRRLILSQTALRAMNNLSRLRKALVIRALIDISCATTTQFTSNMFPQVQGQLRSKVIYLNANQTRFVDVRFTFRRVVRIPYKKMLVR